MKDEERQDLRARTKQFAPMVIRLCSRLPRTLEAKVNGNQLVRCETTPGAHYREACRAKSDADLVSKLEGILQELDESCYWLELLSEGKILSSEEVAPVLSESNELIAMFVAGTRKVKDRTKKP